MTLDDLLDGFCMASDRAVTTTNMFARDFVKITTKAGVRRVVEMIRADMHHLHDTGMYFSDLLNERPMTEEAYAAMQVAAGQSIKINDRDVPITMFGSGPATKEPTHESSYQGPDRLQSLDGAGGRSRSDHVGPESPGAEVPTVPAAPDHHAVDRVRPVSTHLVSTFDDLRQRLRGIDDHTYGSAAVAAVVYDLIDLVEAQSK